MVNATQAAAETARPAALSGEGNGRLLGYVIACVVPAVFWTLLYAAAGWMFGFPVSGPALFAGGLTIGAFLGLVFSAVTVNPRA